MNSLYLELTCSNPRFIIRWRVIQNKKIDDRRLRITKIIKKKFTLHEILTIMLTNRIKLAIYHLK